MADGRSRELGGRAGTGENTIVRKRRGQQRGAKLYMKTRVPSTRDGRKV